MVTNEGSMYEWRNQRGSPTFLQNFREDDSVRSLFLATSKTLTFFGFLQWVRCTRWLFPWVQKRPCTHSLVFGGLQLEDSSFWPIFRDRKSISTSYSPNKWYRFLKISWSISIDLNQKSALNNRISKNLFFNLFLHY